jgi:ABC-type transport system involved in Fe-S cluster assembly fused permease/ATPase subunit
MTNARLEKLKAARAAQIHDFIRDLPDGYEAAAAARDAAWDAYCAKLNKT